MNLTDAIRREIARAAGEAAVSITPERVSLEHADLAHGDYATSIALACAKEARENPRALAERIADALRTGPLVESGVVQRIDVAGPGFINFTLSDDCVRSQMEARNASWAGKKVMVEYTDPNPFKEFHIGHLMSNAIGESVARLFEASGAMVVRAAWQGDVGPHVAKAMFVMMKEPDREWTAAEIGKAYAEGARLYEESETAKLEIDALNAEIYAGEDAAIKRLYERGRKTCLDAFERIYAILGTKFDHYFFEGKEGLAGVGIVREFLEKGIFEESDGAIVFRGEKYGLHTRVFLTSRNLPTYEAKELGLAKAKAEREPDADLSIVVTANEQSDYFKVMLKVFELVFPDIAKKTRHVAHGMMRFAEGKMSSRKGNVITGESLLEELAVAARERAKESRADDAEQLAMQIAVAAVKYQVLKQAAGKDIIFDRERALSLEGDSGPYLQYAHARCCAIEAKAAEAGIAPVLDGARPAGEIERHLARFGDVVERATRELEPHFVATFALILAASFNRWYAEEQILDGTPAAAHKLAIVRAVRSGLARSLSLLGIPAPEKM